MRLRLGLVLVLAAVVAAVTLLVVRPWHDGASTGTRLLPDRAGVKDCGMFVREVRGGGITAAGWSCFTTAMRSGPHARLRFTQYTTEGEPIFTTYSTDGDGIATLLTDARMDHFAGTGSRVQTETCRRPETRPIARGMFLDCDRATPVRAAEPIADVFCQFALNRHIIGAQLTTLANLRGYNVGGPAPGLRPGKNLAPSRPGDVRTAWCWTDDTVVAASPGPRWTLYGALATGEAARFVSTDAGTSPPSGPTSIR